MIIQSPNHFRISDFRMCSQYIQNIKTETSVKGIWIKASDTKPYFNTSQKKATIVSKKGT